MLAQMYSTGSGVPKDAAAAVLWLQKAAAQGHANAQYSLGTCYLLGEGVPKNSETAVQWLTKSAQQGHALAETNLGAIYLNGDGVPQNFRLALSWMEKGSAQGYALAQYSLGKMYQNGYGVRTDETVAAQWYAKAAAQNYPLAKQALAELQRGPASRADKRPAAVADTPSAPQAAMRRDNPPAAMPQEQDAVLKIVQDWAAAWSRKEVDTYLSYYADDFTPADGQSRSDWAALRRARIDERRHIAVSVAAPHIDIAGDTATVVFQQKYVSDNLTETSRKTLVLVQQGGGWKIRQENSGKTPARQR